ncbi:MAG: kelch repeat-containing protein [Sphaerochaetaceae bacterium]
MKKIYWLLASIVLVLIILFVACDSWSTYPPDGKYGKDEYDGDLTWTEVSSSSGWVKRYKHASTVFNDCLWILGGYGYQGMHKDSYLEDVWSSSDGVNWNLKTIDAPWHGRTGHSVVVFDNKMFLIGGYAVDEDAENTHETNHYMNDVWSSSDGITWTKVTDAPFGERAYHSAIVVDDTIYVIGGRRNGTYYYNDIWSSTDGENWSQVLSDVQKVILGKRADMAVTSIGANIYIQGGYTPDYEIAQVDQNDWKKIRIFDTENKTITKGTNPGNSYHNRALMKMVPYDDELYLFSGVEVRREYNMDSNEVYSTWTYADDTNSWSLDSSGSGFGPRYGYTAEIFDGKIWILGGWSYTGSRNDVWTAEVEE